MGKVKAKKATKEEKDSVSQLVSSGFTLSENFIMDQMDNSKKKKKKTEKSEENDTKESKKKIGSMFKVKKVSNIEMESDGEEVVEEEMAPITKKAKKIKMTSEVDDELDAQQVPGFDAPQPKQKVATKRKSDGGGGPKEKMEKPDWKEIKEKQKTLKEDRKKKDGGTRYDISIKAKKIWEELRREDCPKDKQLSLSMELYKLTKGHAKQLVFAHDTARVIECLFGTAPANIKQALFEELKSQTIELAKSQYAHFYLLKVLRHGTKENRTHVMNALSGRIVELMKHKIAAKVVETAYNDWANASQRALLSQEFYGPEFKIFKDEGITTLEAALKKYPEKKGMFLKHMSQAIEPIIAKGVFNHSLLHRLLNEYLTHCGEAEKSEMIQNLREACVQVLHTRDGARIAMLCLWHGTPKDRKEIIKSFKGHISKICQEEHGHMVLMALFDCVDDTKFVYKVVLSEMATHLSDIVFHEHGRKVILYLLAGRDQTYTHPQVVEILKQGDGNPHSKKDEPIRRKELLQFASPVLFDAVKSDPETWLKDSRHCLILAPVLKFCVGDGLAETFETVASVVCKPLDQDTRNMFSSENEKVQYWAEQSAVHMVLKKLIQFDKSRTEPPYFSMALLENLEKDVLMGWLGCNRGAFLLVNMLETEVEQIKRAVAAKVKPVRKFLQKQTNKGADLLDSKLSSSFVE